MNATLSLCATDRRQGRWARLAAAACLVAAVGVPGVLALPAAADTWRATEPLNVARQSHTATLLADGRVLVTSGGGPRGAEFSSELFDPARSRWTRTGDVTVTRRFHTATLLSNGQVLIAGGLTHSNLGGSDFLSSNSAELYDPALGVWRATGSLRDARDSHTATRLPDGRVLVTGGITNFPLGDLSSAELYDPTAGVWAPEDDSMSVSRANHTATLLPNGKVLIAGGQDNGGAPQASAELYDPVSGEWSATGSLATARASHTETLLPDGKVLVTGGRGTGNSSLASAELYDPATGTWSKTGDLGGARYDHTATLLGTQVLVVGGYLQGATASTELYDIATGKWSHSGSIATARYEHTATLLPSGRVLVAGGCCPTSSSELRLLADLSIAIADSPDPVAPGEELTYTLTAQNAGPDGAEAVTARAELPAGVEFVSASFGCVKHGLTAVACNLGSPASAGAPLQRRITVRPTRATSALSTTATVQGSTADPVSANNAVTATTVVGASVGGGGSARPGTGAGGARRGAADSLAAALASEVRRERGLRACVARAVRHARREGSRARRGSPRRRAKVRRHMTRHRSSARRRCLARHGRIPGRVTNLSARALSPSKVALSFRAPGTDRARPPAARAYLIKQSTRPIRGRRGFMRAQTLCRGSCRFSVTRVGAELTFTITGLRPRTTYYYAVAARDNVSRRLGPRSATASARTQ